MVYYVGQNGHSEFHPASEIGQEDGMSEVTITRTVAICNKCGATYDDSESIDMARKWIRAGYAPCPNISCPGELELKEKET